MGQAPGIVKRIEIVSGRHVIDPGIVDSGLADHVQSVKIGIRPGAHLSKVLIVMPVVYPQADIVFSHLIQQGLSGQISKVGISGKRMKTDSAAMGHNVSPDVAQAVSVDPENSVGDRDLVGDQAFGQISRTVRITAAKVNRLESLDGFAVCVVRDGKSSFAVSGSAVYGHDQRLGLKNQKGPVLHLVFSYWHLVNDFVSKIGW